MTKVKTRITAQQTSRATVYTVRERPKVFKRATLSKRK
jgi:hypothetical protein